MIDEIRTKHFFLMDEDEEEEVADDTDEEDMEDESLDEDKKGIDPFEIPEDETL